ncbi:MAG: hypothetical protein JW804_04350 [Sedimentisphaerales bacterium]|nr:hypothetical protein [Sedimentisphaerales bacterium]
MDNEKLDKLLCNLANEPLPDDIAEIAEQKSQQFSREITEQKLNVWQVIMRSKMTKLAAAAVLIIAVCVLLLHNNKDEQPNINIARIVKSPADLTKMVSINAAFRRGGMEAVEEQLDKSLELLGPQYGSLSLNGLYKDLNN